MRLIFFTLIYFFSFSLLAQENKPRSIKIVDEDGINVKSRVKENGKEVGGYDDEDDKHNYVLPENCISSSDYIVFPVNHKKYDGNSIDCPNTKDTCVLEYKRSYTNLLKNSNLFDDSWKPSPEEEKRAFGITALAYNELYTIDNTRREDETEYQMKLADSARVNTIIYTGKYLGLSAEESIFQYPNGRKVASSTLISKLRDFQVENKLINPNSKNKDVKIDGRTLQVMAEASSQDLFKHDFNTIIKQQ